MEEKKLKKTDWNKNKIEIDKSSVSDDLEENFGENDINNGSKTPESEKSFLEYSQSLKQFKLLNKNEEEFFEEIFKNSDDEEEDNEKNKTFNDLEKIIYDLKKEKNNEKSFNEDKKEISFYDMFLERMKEKKHLIKNIDENNLDLKKKNEKNMLDQNEEFLNDKNQIKTVLKDKNYKKESLKKTQNLLVEKKQKKNKDLFIKEIDKDDNFQFNEKTNKLKKNFENLLKLENNVENLEIEEINIAKSETIKDLIDINKRENLKNFYYKKQFEDFKNFMSNENSNYNENNSKNEDNMIISFQKNLLKEESDTSDKIHKKLNIDKKDNLHDFEEINKKVDINSLKEKTQKFTNKLVLSEQVDYLNEDFRKEVPKRFELTKEINFIKEIKTHKKQINPNLLKTNNLLKKKKKNLNEEIKNLEKFEKELDEKIFQMQMHHQKILPFMLNNYDSHISPQSSIINKNETPSVFIKNNSFFNIFESMNLNKFPPKNDVEGKQINHRRVNSCVNQNFEFMENDNNRENFLLSPVSNHNIYCESNDVSILHYQKKNEKNIIFNNISEKPESVQIHNQNFKKQKQDFSGKRQNYQKLKIVKSEQDFIEELLKEDFPLKNSDYFVADSNHRKEIDFNLSLDFDEHHLKNLKKKENENSEGHYKSSAKFIKNSKNDFNEKEKTDKKIENKKEQEMTNALTFKNKEIYRDDYKSKNTDKKNFNSSNQK